MVVSSVRSSGFLTLDDGSRLFYETAGADPEKKTLLCIPGTAGSTQTDLSKQIDLLSEVFNVVAFDRRGYGKSMETKREYSLSYYHQDAEDAAEVMRKLRHEKYSVFGFSAGGVNAIILAANQKDCVENLIVSGCSCIFTADDKEMRAFMRDLDSWMPNIRKPREELYGKEGLIELWDKHVETVGLFADSPGGDICISEAKQVTCPTLIIRGEYDLLMPESHSDFLHKHMQNSTVHVWPAGTHYLHLEHAKEFNQLVTGFINKQ